MPWLRTMAILLTLTGAALATETLVCLGDSVTAGYGLNEDDAYPRRLERLMRRDGLDWRVVNAGVSHQTADGARASLDEIVGCHPSLVFIALGTDDGLQSRPPERVRRSLATICDRLARARIAVALAGAEVPLGYADDYRRSFLDVFRSVAEPRRLPFMPFLLGDLSGGPELRQADGGYPTALGQARIAEHVYAFLRPLLERQGVIAIR